MSEPTSAKPCKLAVIWIDWYAYHVARFRGMYDHHSLHGRVHGIELVGGIGVHQGLKFREDLPADLPIETLMPQSSWQDAGQLTLARKLWAFLTRLDPEAVLVPGYYTLPALAAALWAKLYRRRSILMTESTAADHLRTGWKEALKGLLIRTLFDGAVCGGAAHLRYLKQLGFPEERVAFSYDVVDNAFFACETIAVRQQARPTDLPTNYFLYVGRLSPEKNLDSLVQAFTKYREQGGPWSLVLVGAGPSEELLRKLANNGAYANAIHFPGMKTYRQLPLYYAHARCFILPSTREPWGLVVNEAMASGLPIIVSNRCGCAETLVEGAHNGHIIDPTDISALTASMIALSNSNKQQLVDYSNNSVTRIGNYSPRTLGEEIDKLLAKLAHEAFTIETRQTVA